MLPRLFAISLTGIALLAASAPGAAALSPPDFGLPTSTLRWVDATYNLDQPDLTSMSLTGSLVVYRYDVKGKVYDADDLGDAYVNSNKYAGEPSGSAFVAEIESAVRSAVKSQLEGSFPDATVSGITATVDRATLVAANGDPFDPPVRVSFTGGVTRTREAAGLGSFSDASIVAALDAGARVVTDLTLTASDGYDAHYVLGAPRSPEGLAFTDGGNGGILGPSGASVRIDVDNSQGQQPGRSVTVTLAKPSVSAPTAEDIRSSVDVKLGALQKGAAGIPVTTTVTAEIHAANVAERFPGLLPAKVKMAYISADGMRALRATGALDDAALAKADAALLADLDAKLTSVFGPSAKSAGGLSTSDLAAKPGSPFKADPPAHFNAASTAVYTIAGSTTDDVDLALRIGGTANVNLNLFAANGPTTFTIHPMPGSEIASAQGGAVSKDGQTATIVVQAAGERAPTKLALRGKDVPTFTAPDADIGITVDLKDVDVTVGKAMGGDFGNLVMDVTVTGELGVIELPDEMRSALPASLELPYIASDAIRLLKERGMLSDANLTAIETKLMDRVAQQLSTALGGEVDVTGGFDHATLSPSLVSTPISGDKPVTFTATAHVVKPLAGGPLEQSAAIALYTKDLPLTLPKVEKMDTTYTVILPRGFAVTGLQTEGGASETGKAPDGRDQFTVTPSGERATVTATMAVTPTFVLAKFWPLVLLAVLLLVLLVGTPIALVMLKRRKKQG